VRGLNRAGAGSEGRAFHSCTGPLTATFLQLLCGDADPVIAAAGVAPSSRRAQQVQYNLLVAVRIQIELELRRIRRALRSDAE